MLVEETELKARGNEDETNNYTHIIDWLDKPPVGSPTIYLQRDVLTSKVSSYFRGWSIPRFHARVRKGELLPHTPWRQFTYSGSTTGQFEVVQASNGYWYYYRPVHCNLLDWVITEEELMAYAPNPYNQYVLDAAAKIYSNGYDILTTLAELTEVRKMFVGAARGLLKLSTEKRIFDALKQFGSLSGLAKSKQLFSGWLEFRYGWRTLVYDIFAINELIANYNEKRTRYSEKAGTKYSTQLDVVTAMNDEPWMYLSKQVTDKVHVSIVGSVTADIDIAKVQFNVAQSAWERVPLSFVVDWFLTVGKSISAISFLATQKQYAASAGMKVQVERSLSLQTTSLKSTASSGFRWQTGKGNATLEVRQPCAVPITPHLAFRLDSFKVLDLLGIIVQRTRR